MSVLLYVVGLLVFVAGAVTVGFGFSIELSFGNSLIVAGTSAAIGGLIVFGLGAVVSQLQRVVDGLATRAPIRPSRMPEMFDAPGAPRGAAGRVPLPPKAKLHMPPPFEPPAAAAEAAEMPAEDHFAAAPALSNPDEPPVEVHEDVSLSPFQPVTPPAPVEEVAEAVQPAPAAPSFGSGGLPSSEHRSEPEPSKAWRFPPIPPRPRPEIPPPPPLPPPPEKPARSRQTTHFDAMWPADEPKPAKPPVSDIDQPESVAEPKAATMPSAEPETEWEPAPEHKPELMPAPEPPPAAAVPAQPGEWDAPREDAGERRAIAILKSGVVDGMGYTLYVDGSIEAELPQGTLHFTSINDLRNYLEQNSQA